ncbi:MAG TPA: MBL fold metallo-hydrolase [Bryobacteraceae bacterium]|nr:MBL fold metallo-hydrolase [Bryobacteraceae bacterium]
MRLAAIATFVALGWLLIPFEPSRSAAAPAALPKPPGADYEGDAFTFHKVRDDIYLAVGTGNLTVVSNASIVINDEDVLVVDSHTTPAGAWALLRELRRITSKPVRYVINTHFHVDHVHGNQIYPSNVEIIAHEFTREMIATGKSWSGRAYDSVVGSVPEQIVNLERQIGATALSAGRAELTRQLRVRQNFLAATKAVNPTPPNLTLGERMTLFRGKREIRLLFLGRGHTGGDVVVFLPREKIVMTGDLLLKTVPYMGNCYPEEWVETLERLKALEFDVILGGHGDPFQEREKIDHLQAYLRDLWRQAMHLQKSGVAAEEAARRIDMRAHASHYPNIKGVGVNIVPVLRMYELLGEKK